MEMSIKIDDDLCRDILRSIRGKYSQERMSQAMGYRFNQLYRLESGLTRITWKIFLRACEAKKIPIESAFLKNYFHNLPKTDGKLVKILIAHRSLSSIAKQLEVPRTIISRWASGKTAVPLVQMLRLMDATNLNVIEFLAALVKVQTVASLHTVYQKRMQLRAAHYEMPFLGGVYICLELKAYREAKTHIPRFIAENLSISYEDEKLALERLVSIGAIRLEKDKYVTTNIRLDTRFDRQGFVRLCQYWSAQGLSMLNPDSYFNSLDNDKNRKSTFGYRVCSVSESAYKKIFEEHIRYYNSVTSIIANDSQSASSMIVCLNNHLFLPSEVKQVK